MFKLNTLTVKNFMSIGNQTQAIDFNRNDLTLVLGENLDSGGNDAGSRNGTGKTTIINALSYGLYGKALTKISKNNLINKTNGKNMMVAVSFELDGVEYKIERGRSPNVLKFYVGEHEHQPTDDNSQGDSRETQAAIEELLGMSHDMFKHLVALNTYTEPFLSMGAGRQREIIEQLLGITQLSEKAETLKKLLNGDRGTGEKGTKDRIQEEEYAIKSIQDANKRIEEQIKSLEKRSRIWERNKQEKIDELTQAIDDLEHIDIDKELELHQKWTEYNAYRTSVESDRNTRERSEKELQQHRRIITKTAEEIAALEKHECYACGQEIHDERQNEILASKQDILRDAETRAKEIEESLAVQQDEVHLDQPEETFYDDVSDAYNHRSTLEGLRSTLENKQQEENPYTEQIQDMQESALQEVSFDRLNELSRLRDHQEFLLKLLMNKDSFIRKRIIDQNLAYLNARLSYYLKAIGLPHQVEFKSDLDVQITDLGRDLDFDNLSRGERNRLILSLSWAFRDVWENLYQQINLLFIDEMVDSGMDSSGVENAMSILKKMSRERNKSIWLVSHKDELVGRVNNLMKVIKENGFTSYSNDVEVV